MKTLLVVLTLAVIAAPAFAVECVNGYCRSNGTYVEPYYRSSPNGTVTDNYSFKGNINPYTGQEGTNTYSHDASSPYYTGPDSNGNTGHSGYGSYDGDEGENGQ
jgi:hypothetical protein